MSSQAPSTCLALDGADVRNGWLVLLDTGTLCCVERGTFDGLYCIVGCHASVRVAGDFAGTGKTGEACYSRCFDTITDLTPSTSIVAPTGVVNGPAVKFDTSLNGFSASQTTTPVRTFFVEKTAANRKRSPGSQFLLAAYGLNSGYTDITKSIPYGVDVFCTQKGPFASGV